MTKGPAAVTPISRRLPTVGWLERYAASRPLLLSPWQLRRHPKTVGWADTPFSGEAAESP